MKIDDPLSREKFVYLTKKIECLGKNWMLGKKLNAWEKIEYLGKNWMPGQIIEYQEWD